MKSTKTLIAAISLKGTGTNTTLRQEAIERASMYSTQGTAALVVEPVVEEQVELEIPAFLIRLQNERKMAKWGHL